MSATAILSAPGVDLDRPVLICGVGRSGTSLLQSMLNAHPELCFPPETHFFRRFVAHHRTRGELERAGVSAFQRQLEGDEYFERAELSAAELLDPERERGLDLARVYRRLLRAYTTREGKSRVGDKDPLSIEHLDSLHANFPAAYVLHVVRDPRDVLLSRTKAAWSAGRPWWMHALISREQLRRGRRLGRKLFGARYLEIHYEELIARPEETLRRICEHVAIPYDACMLEFSASAARLVDQRELSWKKETLGPLLSSNSGKWRAELSPFQIRWTQAVCTEYFSQLGYQRAEGPLELSAAERVTGALAPVLRAAASVAYYLRRRLAGG